MLKGKPAWPGATTIERKVTIFEGTRKYEARLVEFRRGPSPPHRDAFHFRFKRKGQRWWERHVDHESRTVILDGWDHPDFEPSNVLVGPDGVAQFLPIIAWYPGLDQEREKEKEKIERELGEYLAKLGKGKILVDTREAIIREE